MRSYPTTAPLAGSQFSTVRFGSRIVFEEASPTDWGTEGNVTQTCVVCLDVGTIRKPIVSCKQCMTPVHRGCYEAAQGDEYLENASPS